MLPHWLAAVNDDPFEVEPIADQLESNLQDFIAESRFGWGEQR